MQLRQWRRLARVLALSVRPHPEQVNVIMAAATPYCEVTLILMLCLSPVVPGGTCSCRGVVASCV